MTPIISARDLTVTLNNHTILDRLSFSIAPGETVAIIGPNGSGKTTLLKALLGLIPYRGEISIFDQTPKNLRAIAHRIGYVPQRLDFDRTMPITVSELLHLHQSINTSPNIQSALAASGAESLLAKPLGVLSGGEFQRVLISLALLNQPDLLFLDEPAASIDMEGAGEIYSVIQKLQRKRPLTIVLVSHDVDVVFRYATQVLCVNHRLICSGVPMETLTKETLEQLYGAHHTVYAHHDQPHD